MSRSLSSAMLTEIAKQAVTPVQLIAFYFYSGTEYFTTAHKDLVFGGNTYLATGGIIQISDVTEELAQRVTTMQITVSGVDQSHIAVALTEDYINRDVIIYHGLLDANDELIVDPFYAFRGSLDDFAVSENDRGSTLTWTATSELADFERVGGRRANHVEQQIFYSGDLGFEFIDQIVKDLKWGRA